MSGKSSKDASRLAWVSKKLLAKLKQKGILQKVEAGIRNPEGI